MTLGDETGDTVTVKGHVTTSGAPNINFGGSSGTFATTSGANTISGNAAMSGTVTVTGASTFNGAVNCDLYRATSTSGIAVDSWRKCHVKEIYSRGYSSVNCRCASVKIKLLIDGEYIWL